MLVLLKAMEHLESFIADCDRKTELAKRRLKETQEELSEEANAKVGLGRHRWQFSHTSVTKALQPQQQTLAMLAV